MLSMLVAALQLQSMEPSFNEDLYVWQHQCSNRSGAAVTFFTVDDQLRAPLPTTGAVPWWNSQTAIYVVLVDPRTEESTIIPVQGYALTGEWDCVHALVRTPDSEDSF